MNLKGMLRLLSNWGEMMKTRKNLVRICCWDKHLWKSIYKILTVVNGPLIGHIVSMYQCMLDFYREIDEVVVKELVNVAQTFKPYPRTKKTTPKFTIYPINCFHENTLMFHSWKNRLAKLIKFSLMVIGTPSPNGAWILTCHS